MLSAPPASACEWWWEDCGEGTYIDQPPPRGYGYRGRPAYRHRGASRTYGYAGPAWGYRDPYEVLPSTALPDGGWYPTTAARVPNANTVGLTAPIATRRGLMEGGMPAKGPSLFGPNPPPALGYYYSGYGGPAYGYNPPPYGAPLYGSIAPPPDTPSWWVEPRRRR
jgi:hypothetical protein